MYYNMIGDSAKCSLIDFKYYNYNYCNKNVSYFISTQK